MERVDITILGREYSLACAPDQRDALIAAVNLVDQRMQTIKESGKIISNERIAVMAAIHLANELLTLRAPSGPLSGIALGDFRSKIDDMNGVLDSMLGTTT